MTSVYICYFGVTEPLVQSQVIPYLRELAKRGIGISFRKPTFAQIASSPTKIPEFLAAGLPVVCNRGIGDSDALVEANGVGVVVSTFAPGAYAAAAVAVLKLTADPTIRERCIRTPRRRILTSQVWADRVILKCTVASRQRKMPNSVQRRLCHRQNEYSP